MSRRSLFGSLNSAGNLRRPIHNSAFLDPLVALPYQQGCGDRSDGGTIILRAAILALWQKRSKFRSSAAIRVKGAFHDGGVSLDQPNALKISTATCFFRRTSPCCTNDPLCSLTNLSHLFYDSSAPLPRNPFPRNCHQNETLFSRVVFVRCRVCRFARQRGGSIVRGFVDERMQHLLPRRAPGGQSGCHHLRGDGGCHYRRPNLRRDRSRGPGGSVHDGAMRLAPCGGCRSHLRLLCPTHRLAGRGWCGSNGSAGGGNHHHRSHSRRCSCGSSSE